MIYYIIHKTYMSLFFCYLSEYFYPTPYQRRRYCSATGYWHNAPSLATRLTDAYRDRTYTGKCGPASLDAQYKK